MIRVMRIAFVILVMPMAAVAQNEARPTCVEVAKDIDKYATRKSLSTAKSNLPKFVTVSW